MKASVSSRAVKAFCKVIVASDSDKVVGIHMVCPDASEIMQVGRAPWVQLPVHCTALSAVHDNGLWACSANICAGLRGHVWQGWAAALKAGLTKHQMDTTVGLHPTSAEEFVTMYEPTRVYKDGKEQKKSHV